MNPKEKALFETSKMVMRYIILWAPLILTFIVDWQEKGIAFALSAILTAADKFIHSDKSIKATGILPF